MLIESLSKNIHHASYKLPTPSNELLCYTPPVLKLPKSLEQKLTILFPNQDVSRWETNDASIVAKLEYGESSFLLTGDSTKKAEYILMNLDKSVLDSDVLKVGHHGSKNSTSLAYAEVISPEYAVISAGKDNSYGHPHKEVLDRVKAEGAELVSTIESGTITFESDGVSIQRK